MATGPALAVAGKRVTSTAALLEGSHLRLSAAPGFPIGTVLATDADVDDPISRGVALLDEARARVKAYPATG